MTSVSLCVIARNEEANLAACLGPLVPLVTETIVVDTGSTDETRSIAESFGARVFDFPWCDDFAAARNESLREATGDWILWMDADDRLDAANLGKLAALLAGLGNDRVAHLMSCVSLAADGQPTFEAKHVRLFPNAPAHRWARRVHEQILPALRSTGCDLRETGISVHHVGYQDHAVFLRKIERNLRLLELEYGSRSPDGWYFYQRGGALFDLKRFAEAIVSLHLAAPLAADDGVPRIHALLAEAYAHEEPGLDDALVEVQRVVRDAVGPVLMLLSADPRRPGRLWLRESEPHVGHGSRAGVGPFFLLDATVGLRSRHLLARVSLVEGRIDESKAHTLDRSFAIGRLRPAVLTLGNACSPKMTSMGSTPSRPTSRRDPRRRRGGL